MFAWTRENLMTMRSKTVLRPLNLSMPTTLPWTTGRGTAAIADAHDSLISLGELEAPRPGFGVRRNGWLNAGSAET